jgi:catechol 2,3-dioxygenase-like lactoylglutathione lyase family enzyme
MSNLRHCGIVVSDLKLALNIFTTIFDFKVIKEGEVTGAYAEKLFNTKGLELKYVKLKAKNNKTLIELWKIKNFLVPKQGMAHIALTVNNIKEVYDQLQKKKLECFSEPFKAHDSNVQLFFFKDNDGNIFEVVQDPEDKGLTTNDTVSK